MQLLRSSTVRQTQQFAASLLRRARGSRGRLPIILALTGELGSGKTTFIQGLARTLGVPEAVQSPTFVIAKWYRLPARQRSFRHLVHIDAYRLNTAGARRLGFPATFRDPSAIVVVEWADKIRRIIPRRAIWLRFSHGARSRERLIRSTF